MAAGSGGGNVVDGLIPKGRDREPLSESPQVSHHDCVLSTLMEYTYIPNAFLTFLVALGACLLQMHFSVRYQTAVSETGLSCILPRIHHVKKGNFVQCKLTKCTFSKLIF